MQNFYFGRKLQQFLDNFATVFVNFFKDCNLLNKRYQILFFYKGELGKIPNNLEEYQENIFESIKHFDEQGNEYWSARELQKILGYKEWRLFFAVIEKSQIACSQSNNEINSHFGVKPKIVTAGVTSKSIFDYKLSRYACYLIVQNANPKFENVALGQTYFAIQTRKMEITELEYNKLSEDEKRLYRRKQTKDGNKILYKIAKEKGVKNFDKFTNAGYKGLYNGETADDIAKRKRLKISRRYIR